MTFITTLIALIIERFFDWSHIRQWHWFSQYQSWLMFRVSRFSPPIIFIICLAPLLVLVALINHLLTGWFFDFFKLLFGTLVLIYCLGPNNFWAQIYAAIKVLHTEEPHVAREQLHQLFQVNPLEPSQVFHKNFTQRIFIEANCRVFAVFFWFLILGPVGAVLYRSVDICKMRGTQLQSVALKTQQYLDWLPIRVFTFIFALAGHFNDVIKFWKKGWLSSPVANDYFLSVCGLSALDVLESDRIPEDGSAEKESLSLLDRAFVIALVILALSVLII